MGVVLYRKGNTHTNRGIKCEACVFPVDRMQANLNAGWVTDPRELVDEGEEIRNMAKLAGIRNWKTAKIETLKEKLGYEQSQD